MFAALRTWQAISALAAAKLLMGRERRCHREAVRPLGTRELEQRGVMRHMNFYCATLALLGGCSNIDDARETGTPDAPIRSAPPPDASDASPSTPDHATCSVAPGSNTTLASGQYGPRNLFLSSQFVLWTAMNVVKEPNTWSQTLYRAPRDGSSSATPIATTDAVVGNERAFVAGVGDYAFFDVAGQGASIIDVNSGAMKSSPVPFSDSASWVDGEALYLSNESSGGGRRTVVRLKVDGMSNTLPDIEVLPSETGNIVAGFARSGLVFAIVETIVQQKYSRVFLARARADGSDTWKTLAEASRATEQWAPEADKGLAADDSNLFFHRITQTVDEKVQTSTVVRIPFEGGTLSQVFDLATINPHLIALFDLVRQPNRLIFKTEGATGMSIYLQPDGGKFIELVANLPNAGRHDLAVDGLDLAWSDWGSACSAPINCQQGLGSVHFACLPN